MSKSLILNTVGAGGGAISLNTGYSLSPSLINLSLGAGLVNRMSACGDS